jgi:hypothetical protein
VRYEEDTVERTRAASGGSVRRRTEGWLLKRLRKEWEHEPPPSYPEELCFREKEIEEIAKMGTFNLIKFRCLQALNSLVACEKKPTVVALANMTGLSRTTVTKYVRFLVREARPFRFANNPLLDNLNDEINRTKDGRVRRLNFEPLEEE